ncbi:hypothetical protein LNQ81_12605 [Myroides sp. M-43]|uniref:hypothetical protein n=1 Tax=Myroides oncorhynchi TaxID=2893756 RepID=UPI001E5940AE|nr:hypothetical protein [Myroides oncorhynchi]MCC9043513.1 hypothetical protein [Myroides oncorhynchi]
MGIIIGGIVVDKNYQSHIEDLEYILGKKLVYQGDTIFKKACVNELEADYCEVYFSDRGTLVLTCIDRASLVYKATGQQVLSFVIDEESMTFNLNYTRNNFLVRKVTEVEADIIDSKGELLEFEENESDKIGLIYHVIEELLDQQLWDIDANQILKRYHLESIDNTSGAKVDTSYVISTLEFEDLEPDNIEPVKLNDREEITKVKRSKKSILTKVIKGLGLEDKEFMILKNKKGE